MFRSIFTRIFWTNFITVAIVLLTSSALMLGHFTYYNERKQYDLSVKTAKNIEELTAILQIENNTLHSRSIYENTLSSWSDFTNSDITVTNRNGKVFSSTTNITRIPHEFSEKILSGETAVDKSTLDGMYKKRVYTVGIPMYYRNNIIGAVYFTSPLLNTGRDITDLANMLTVSFLISMIIALIFVYFQSKRISAPIKDINKAVNYIASGKFDKRVEINSADEVGQLASSFNYMAEALSKSDEMHNAFISDVSHELRTPMTSISGFVGGILDGTIPPEKQNDYLKLVHAESIRLAKLTTDMLEMSKMSSSEYKLHIDEFDINELIRLCIIQLEGRISDKNLDLDVNFNPDSIKVLGDKDAIQRVIINILDNAVKFSFNNTKITISTWAKDQKAYVSIGNFGNGIEKSELGNIFDRFYKTDKSRISDTKGAGLGLSMVKNIISLHKQQIWVDSTETKPGTGVKFTKFTFTLKAL